MAGKPRLPRQQMRELQWTQVRGLLDAVLGANPFYTRKFEAIRPRLKRTEPAGWEEFARRIPFTTKAELEADQQASPPYGTNLTYPLARYTRCHQTSGTTGVPVRWLDTPESWDAMVTSWCEVYRAAGLTAADRVLFAFSFGPFIGFWLAFEAAERLGALCIPGGGLSSAGRLRTILDQGATVLCCTPTYALHLAEVARQEDIDLHAHQVRRVVVAGEPGGSIPATRARIESLWRPARVFDHHGMTEVGPVTFECPAQPGLLHVIEAAYYAEIIDPKTTEPARDGEQGELVLTTLGRTGSPLLRYRTGDLVRPAFAPTILDPAPCACGRHELALTGGILGRVDDMVVIRGVNVFPSAVEAILRGFRDVAEYQATVREAGGLSELALRVEPGAECVDVGGLVRRIEHAFRTALALRVPVVAVPPGSLPRFELKARRWVRL